MTATFVVIGLFAFSGALLLTVSAREIASFTIYMASCARRWWERP